MKTIEEIDLEIQRNVDIIGKQIEKQKQNIKLELYDQIERQDANSRITALLWVLGEYDRVNDN